MKGNQFEYWQQALGVLKTKIPAVIFETIILDSKPGSFINGKLTIILPFAYMLRRVTPNDKNTLEAVLSEVAGKPVSVEFVVSEESEKVKSTRIAVEAQNLISKRKSMLTSDKDDNDKSNAKRIPTRSGKSWEIEEGFVPLNPQLTFETFVVGENSLMAHTASMAVARRPGEDYNPLYIYSGVGLGKTHLLHAIGQHAVYLNPALVVRFVPAETFTYDLVDAIGDKASMRHFRAKYRRCDILLIDDIHFLIDKEATQEAFFHTLNDLFEMNKQVVITSDRHPKELRTLKERLVSRFQFGVVADIQKPGFETRMAILKRKAETHNFVLPNEILEVFASQVQGSIRSLVGCILAAKNFEESFKRHLTLDDAQAIADSYKEDSVKKDSPITIKMIFDLICHHYRIPLEELIGPSRESHVSHPRHIGMYLARKYTSLSYKEIARTFRKKDHATVHHGVKKIESRINKDAILAREVSYIEEILLGQSPRA